MPIVGNFLFAGLEKEQVRLTPELVENADAIVVLGGMLTNTRGVTADQYVTEWADADRFFGGIELFQAKKAPTLVFTRGQLPWNRNTPPEGEYLKEIAERMGVAEADILLTSIAANTEAEAKATADLFSGRENTKIILVTSAFHMPRAVPLFTAQGFEVITYPVDFKTSTSDITFMSFLPDAGALDQSSMVFREFIGRLYYFVLRKLRTEDNEDLDAVEEKSNKGDRP